MTSIELDPSAPRDMTVAAEEKFETQQVLWIVSISPITILNKGEHTSKIKTVNQKKKKKK